MPYQYADPRLMNDSVVTTVHSDKGKFELAVSIHALEDLHGQTTENGPLDYLEAFELALERIDRAVVKLSEVGLPASGRLVIGAGTQL
jgi:hypothetical protein